MIIRKTKSFHKKFLRDLADITIFKNEYLDSLERWELEGKDLFDIGYRKQPSKTLKFFGSYFDKKEGDYVTDIDVIAIINSVKDDNFYLRLKDILKNIDKTPFRFVRFYCGYITGLQPPWKIGQSGECSFDIETVDKWIEDIRVSYPEVYKKVEPYLVKSTISMLDLIKANEAIEPVISLTWSREEIIQGYKFHNSVKYDFKTSMIDYPRYRVMKFLYEYSGEYCFVDLNFIARDKSIPTDKYDALTYYTNDIYKKFKYLKKMIEPKNLENFFNDRKAAIGNITPLAAFIELLTKLKKYNVIPLIKIEKMTQFAKEYAIQNKINTIDYDEIQELILEKIRPLYEKYRHLISEEYKLNIYIYDIRTLQITQQIPKEIIAKRHLPEYDCSLFPIRVDHIEYLYKKAKNLLLDPYKLYGCIHGSWIDSSWSFPRLIEDLFVKKEYKIERGLGKYKLYLDGNLVKSSPNLKSLQLIALNGE